MTELEHSFDAERVVLLCWFRRVSASARRDLHCPKRDAMIEQGGPTHWISLIRIYNGVHICLNPLLPNGQRLFVSRINRTINGSVANRKKHLKKSGCMNPRTISPATRRKQINPSAIHFTLTAILGSNRISNWVVAPYGAKDPFAESSTREWHRCI